MDSLSPTQLPRSSLESAIGASFRDQDLLRLALVHRSYLNERPDAAPDSNERLEFLGDALVGMVVANELYQRHPDWSEGELTRARAQVVRGETLALVAERLQLGRYLFMSRGEEAGGGRERERNLAAAFEALVGAVLLDRGYEQAGELVLRVLSEEMSTLAADGLPQNAKSALQELVQGQGHPSPIYRIVEVTGEDHAPMFTAEVTVADNVAGRGTGARKAEAEQAAAADALEGMGEQL